MTAHCSVRATSAHLRFAAALVCALVWVPSFAAAASGVPGIDTINAPANEVGEYTSVAVGTDGRPVISYYDATAQTLKVAKCGNAACTSGNTIITVDDPPINFVGLYTAIAIGTDGLPTISYYASDTLRVAKCANAACTGTATITTVDSSPTNAVGSYTSIAIGTDGRPVVSYNDATAGALKVARCANAACTGVATITTVDDPANQVGYSTSITIGTDGLPVISYHDNTARSLKVAHCVNAACSGISTITTVDDHPTDDLGRFTSIAIGTDGLPVISYLDNSAAALKVAHCANAACTGMATITTVDNPANSVAQGTDIAIGTDGLAVISYYDISARALKVAHCANAVCSGMATITTVDDPPNNSVGAYNSIAIGTDGRPVVSYYDATARALRVAHCANAACTGVATITIIDDTVFANGFETPTP